MPFKSQAQRRKFYAMEADGEISTKTLNKWRKETPKGKKLPEKVKKAELDGFNDELKKLSVNPLAVGRLLSTNSKIVGKRLAGSNIKNIGTTAATSVPRNRDQEKSAGIGQTLKGFGRHLSGKNVSELVKQHGDEIFQSPSIRLEPQQTKDVLTGYAGDVLKGVRPRPTMPEATGGMPGAHGNTQLIQQLADAASEIGKQRVKMHKARGAVGGATALGVGVGGGTALALKGKEKGAEEDLGARAKQLAPAVAGAGVGLYPIIQGLRSGALSPRKTGQTFETIEELRKAIKEGDILMTSSAGKGSSFKPLISALGGDPYGYHLETVTDVPKSLSRDPTVTHATTESGAAASEFKKLSPKEDVIIRRLKDPEAAKTMSKNIKARSVAEEGLGRVFGESAVTTQYDKPQALRAAGKSFMPSWMSKLLTSKKGPTAGRAVCSSLPGMACPVPLSPGVAGKDVLPHHIRTSPAMETVGQFRAPRKGIQKMFERGYQALPWAVRLGAGAGLGYGAYRGAKALLGPKKPAAKLSSLPKKG